MQTRTKQRKTILFMMWLFVASFVFMTVSNYTVYAASEPTSADDIIPSISLNSGTVTALVDVGDFNTLKTGSATISVTTPNPTGYTMTLTTSGANTNLVSGTNTIPTLSSNSSVSSFPVGRWGYSLDNTTYKPAPSVSGSGDTLATTSEANSTANTYTLYIGAKVANTQPSGTYTNTLVVTAVANPLTYSISYNANGGSPTPETQTFITNNGGHTFTISSTVPSKSGYTFAGWCSGTITGNNGETPSCSSATYSANSTINLPYTTPVKILYAMWQIGTFDVLVNFAGNGVTGVSFTAAGQTTQNVSTSGSTVALKYGVQYEMTMTFAYRHEFDNWSINDSSYGVLSSTSTNPTYFTPNQNSDSAIITATGKRSIITIANAENLQEVEACPETVPIGQIYQLPDTRDDSVYHTARLADGRCWLLDNLQLDISDSEVQANLSSTTTHATDTALSYLINGGGTAPYAVTGVSDVTTSYSGNAYYNPLISTSSKDVVETSWGLGNGKDGIFYNTCAMSAGSYCYDESGTIDALYVANDICPYGWRLPTGNDSIGEWHEVVYAYNDNSNPDSTDSVHYNLSLSLWGLGHSFASGETTWAGTYGRYLSSDTKGKYLFAALYIYGHGISYTGSSLNSNIGRSTGFVVRCISSNPTQFSLVYDTNAGNAQVLNAPINQTMTADGTAVFTISNTVPTRKDGYIFASWNTAADGSGTSYNPGGAVGTIESSITLYAIWLPILQDWTGCDSLTTNNSIIMVDERDQHQYVVGKIYGGTCWILDNLMLDLTDPDIQETLSSNNTNASNTAIEHLINGGGATSDPYATASVADWSSSYSFSAPLIYKNLATQIANTGGGRTNIKTGDLPRSTTGIYYNYCAATAGSYCYGNGTSAGTSSGSSQYDVCPAGWRLPTGGSSGEVKSVYTSSGSNVNNFLDYLDLAFTGYYYKTSIDSYTVNGIFWTSTRYNNNSMYRLYASSSSIGHSNNSGNRGYGYPIRCIYKTETSQFTLAFDGNVTNTTVSGLPVSQTIETNKIGAKFSIPTDVPTRADSGTFLGWSDDPTAITPTYLPGDDYITESVSSTLYAIWE